MSNLSFSRRRPRALRGVTLIEMMVVIALLGVMGAIAAPQLLPIVKKARMNSEGEAVASFLNAVRERAIAKNRCFRVIVTASLLTAEERDSGDCATSLTLTGIDGWNTASSRLVADKGTTYTYAATDCASCTGTLSSDIIFRPSGRLRGDNDLSTTDDRIRIRVQQATLNEEKDVVVMGSGRICVIHIAGTPPSMATPNARNDCNLAIP